MKNKEPEIQEKAQFDAINEKQARKNFNSFAKLVEQISDMEEVSPEFLEEIEMCVMCLGIVLVEKDERFTKYAEKLDKEEKND